MSIWNKILLGLIFIASLVFFHAVTRTVKTYQFWAQKVVNFEAKLKEVNAEIVSLRTADHEHPRPDKTVGVEQLRFDLNRLLANRGRVWTKCEKQGKPEADKKRPGITLVNVSTEDAGSISAKMLLYAFEEGDDQSPGRYLGEFSVSEMSDKDKRITLASTTPMEPHVLKNLTDSKGPLVLYEMVPTDEHEILVDARDKQPDDFKKWVTFDELTPDQRKQVADQYLNDGKTINGKEYNRPLRDFIAIFRDCETYRTLYEDRLNSVTNDNLYLTDAKEKVKVQEADVQKVWTGITADDKRAHKERDAVAEHGSALQRMLTFNQKAVTDAIARNLQYAQEIARRQKEAADLIDRRTRSMAQSGPEAH